MLNVENMRAYQALCSFCSWGLFAAPENDALAGLAADCDMFLEEPFSVVAPEAAAAFSRALSVGATEEGLADLAREVHLDRTYLFLMVGSSRTSPYESVYRTDDCTMFGPTTLEVREAYRACGLRFERAATEPDDHLGIEFAFLAHVLDQAAAAAEQGDEVESERMLGVAKTFLSEHVLVFAPVYLGNVQIQAQSAFYGSLAGIAQGVLEALAETLGAVAVETVDERYILSR